MSNLLTAQLKKYKVCCRDYSVEIFEVHGVQSTGHFVELYKYEGASARTVAIFFEPKFVVEVQ